MISLIIKWGIAIIFCLVLQTTIIPSMAIFDVQPDLLIVLLFFLCVKHGVIPGIYVGFFLGLGQDLYSPSMLGQNALAKTVIGFFMGFFNEKVMRTDPILKIVILIISFVIHDALFTGAQLLKTGDSLLPLLTELLARTLPRAIYTTLFVFLIMFWDASIKPNFKR